MNLIALVYCFLSFNSAIMATSLGIFNLAKNVRAVAILKYVTSIF